MNENETKKLLIDVLRDVAFAIMVNDASEIRALIERLEREVADSE